MERNVHELMTQYTSWPLTNVSREKAFFDICSVPVNAARNFRFAYERQFARGMIENEQW